MSRFEHLIEADVLSGLDVELARMLVRRFDDVEVECTADDPGLWALGVALASRAVQRGHVCADLERLTTEPLLDNADRAVEGVDWPELGSWCASLARAPFVGDRTFRAPVRLVGRRLYLARYLDYEERIGSALLTMARSDAPAVRPEVVSERLAALFTTSENAQPIGNDGQIVEGADRQQLAAAVACSRRLTVVSGGPGTGKTTTVVKILLLLIEQRLAAGQQPRILLLAPTGKAAQRLSESIRTSDVVKGVSESVRELLVKDAMTVHRALGFRPQTPSRFAHDVDNPLAADLVVVDEASMIDVAMFAKLLDALPAAAQLVLLGDRNQLASVEAGAIYGDVCRAGSGGFSPEFGARLRALFGAPSPAAGGADGAIADCVVELTKSYRYTEDGGIAKLAAAIQTGDADQVLEVLGRGYADVEWAGRDAEPAAVERELVGRILSGTRLTDAAPATPVERLRRLTEFRVLAAHRRGRLGVEAVNRLVEEGRGGGAALVGAPYAGRPVMVTRNDYGLGLWNGDLGVLSADPVAKDAGELAAWFPTADAEKPRRLALSRLPDHEVVHAMTIHKSQGSEFGEVVVVLPEAASPILTRELVYTAITRAKQKVVVYASEPVLRRAIERSIDRASGLYDRLKRG